MENGILVFSQYGFGNIRVIMQGGEPWFVAKDVCDCLELDLASGARGLDDDEKALHTMQTPGGAQEMSIISEAGLYSLILRSRKHEAKAFKRWVTHDILPSIRKTGGYSAPSSPAKAEISVQSEVECALMILKAAGITGNQLAIAADNYYRKRTGISVIEASGVELVAPKQQQLLTPTQLGKELGLSGRKVNLMLAGLGLQRRIGDVWEPTEDGKARGAVLMDTGKRHGDGAPVRQLKWPSDVVNALR